MSIKEPRSRRHGASDLPGGSGADRSFPDDIAAVRTYRYLRLGMVVVTIALIASVWRQRTESGCYQGSISAYFYTPARPVFVAGMVAIGVMLIVLKGNTILEDVLLDVAGMLAPIVALVPTGFEPVCVPGLPFDHGDGTLTTGIRSEVQNNLWAYLVAASAALLIAFAIFLRDTWRTRQDPPGSTVARVGLLATTAVVIGIGWWAFTTDRILEWHAWAAIVMFGLLALASIWNGIALIISDPSTPWPRTRPLRPVRLRLHRDRAPDGGRRRLHQVDPPRPVEPPDPRARTGRDRPVRPRLDHPVDERWNKVLLPTPPSVTPP